MTIGVLLADDQPLLRTGFRMILEAEPDIAVVGEASDGARAIELTRALRPDVVLMDIRMPGTDGIEATRQILSAGDSGTRPPPVSRVLVLTTFDLDEYIVEALRAGASGFLLKDVPPDDLICAIHVIAAGEAIVSPTVTRRLLDWFASRLPAPGNAGPAPAGCRTPRCSRRWRTWPGRGRNASNTSHFSARRRNFRRRHCPSTPRSARCWCGCRGRRRTGRTPPRYITLTKEVSVSNSVTLSVTIESSKVRAYGTEAGITIFGFADIKGQLHHQLSRLYSVTTENTFTISEKTTLQIPPLPHRARRPRRSSIRTVLRWQFRTSPK